MQIRKFKFLLAMFMLFGLSVSHGGILPDYYQKQILDTRAQALRNKDISREPKFENVSFTREICNGKANENKFCIKNFKDIQVQNAGQAIQIAKDYAKIFDNRDVVCSKYYYVGRDNDDHIFCSTTYNAKQYEFIFDDITETKSDIKYKNGIANAYCRMYLWGKDSTGVGTQAVKDNGAYRPLNDALTCRASGADFANKCTQMSKKLMAEYGFFASLSKDKYNCNVDFATKKCDTLQTFDNINNTEFKNLQIKYGYDIAGWLGTYIQNQSKNIKVKSVRCDKAAHTCLTGGLLNNPHDDYVTCYVTDMADNQHKIEFQFDDLSETSDTRDKGGKSEMQCINSDGVFDGEKCQGITKAQCLSLKNDGINAEWNEQLYSCVMPDATALTKLDRNIEIATAVGKATLIVAATVAIPGVGSVAILAATTQLALTLKQQDLVNRQREEMMTFLDTLWLCTAEDRAGTEEERKKLHKNPEERKACIKGKLKEFGEKYAGYMDQMDDNLAKAVDDSFAKMLSNPKNSFTSAEIEKLKAQIEKDKKDGEYCLQGNKTGLRAEQCFVDGAILVIDIALMFVDSAGVVKNISNGFKTASSAGHKFKALTKVMTEYTTDAVKQPISKIDDYSDIKEATQNLTGYLGNIKG